MATIGVNKGLSFVNDWDQDIDRMYQREEYAAKVEKQRMDETQYFASLMKKGHGSTPYVEGKLNSFYKEHTKKVADFAIKNPNFRTDVTLMQEFLDLNDQFLNNPILQQDLQVKQNFERLQAAVASGQITTAHFEREKNKYLAYANADPSTEAEPYVFENPRHIDTNKLITEAQATLKTITSLKQEGLKYNTYQGVDPTSVSQAASALLSIEENQLAFKKEYEDALKADPKMEGLFPSLQAYTENRVEAGNKLQMVKTEYDDAYLRNLSNRKQTPVPGQYFVRHLYPQLFGMKDGQTVAGNLHGIALTMFNEKDDPINVNPSDGALVLNELTGKYDNLSFSTTMQATNFKSYKNIGGKLYGEVAVKASGTMISNGKKKSNMTSPGAPNEVDSLYTNIGFSASTNQGNAMASFLGGTPGKLYEGTILVPLNLESANLVGFDRSFAGITEVEAASNFYSDPNVIGAINNDLVASRKAFIDKVGATAGVTYRSEVNDGSLSDDFVYVSYQGKETDSNGNPYVYNHKTKEIRTYKK